MSERILSVGIDIGTSTTSLVFSHLTIEKTTGDMFMPKTEITDKTVIYRSPIYFTPLKSDIELDTIEIRRIVESEYRAAAINAEDVETGAVIITGDTARKINAENVLAEISEFAGDFVVAAAGPDFESILAGKGSGAEQYSADKIATICNMDIGGGTTNTAVFYDRKCIDADCLDIGGRLIRFKKGTAEIEYIFPKISVLAEKLGIEAQYGKTLSHKQIKEITDAMAEAMMGKLDERLQNSDFFYLCTEEKPRESIGRNIDAVSFSGGVGKLVYEEEKDKLRYGDIGVYLAESLKETVIRYGIHLISPKETISATVIGAGNHAVEVSGGTITITQREKLPLKNLPIITVDEPLSVSADAFQKQFLQRLHWVQVLDGNQNIALNIKVSRKMGFADISQLADRIASISESLLERQDTLVVVIYGDYGKVLGQSISIRLPQRKDVICIDGVDVGKGDYIDIGRPVGVADSVPVVIKTIAFNY